jgi:hypothetical protein
MRRSLIAYSVSDWVSALHTSEKARRRIRETQVDNDELHLYSMVIEDTYLDTALVSVLHE